MSISKRLFGTTKDGEQVFAYEMDNQNGLSAEILSYGGVIRKLVVTKDGAKTDVVLGHETLEQYEDRDGCFGALIGRNANRIREGKFELNGKKYQLGLNKKGHNLHGGFKGFNKKVWDVIENDSADEPSIVLSLTSPDGDEGYPGTMDVTVTYTLTKNNALMINYKAKSDADTICNFTNHSYFNLSGHNSGTVYDQTLQINSDFYTAGDVHCIPTGEVLKVDGTPFDFREAKPIGQDIKSDFGMMDTYLGYDHNFAINGRGYRKAAEAHSAKTGITMEVYTSECGMQLYSGNYVDEIPCKDNAVYGMHHAFCLETQGFPNAINIGHFPTPVLKKGEIYDTTTEYRFK